MTKMKITPHPTYRTYLFIILGKICTSMKYTKAKIIDIHAHIFIASDE